MNPYTGHIVAFKDIRKVEARYRDGFIELPETLNVAANKVLRGRKVAKVSLKSGGKLSRWAAAERKKDKERSRNRVAKQSRKRNRA